MASKNLGLMGNPVFDVTLTYRSDDDCETSFILPASHVVVSIAHIVRCLLGHLLRCDLQARPLLDDVCCIVSPLDPGVGVGRV